MSNITESRQKIVDKVLAIMEQGTGAWRKLWTDIAMPINAITGKRYRGLNNLNLSIIAEEFNLKDNRWATFNQVKKAGLSIKKGAKGMPIEKFDIIDKRTNKSVDWKKVEEEIKDLSHDDRVKWRKKNLYTMINTYIVFNGDNIVGLKEQTKPTDSYTLLSRVENIIANSEAKITNDGEDRAFYRRITDTIHLPLMEQFSSIESYYSTALHEIAHSTGHETRLGRQFGEQKFDDLYAKEELVAELLSLALS